MLKTGAILNFLVAAGHLACLPWLYPVLSIYRIDGIMETLALRYGAAIPYLLTVAIAFIFAVFGLYGLSGAGIIRRLPLLETGIYTIATLFLLRAVAGVAEMAVTGCALLADSTAGLSCPRGGPPRPAAFAAAVVGTLYLLGGRRKFGRQESE